MGFAMNVPFPICTKYFVRVFPAIRSTLMTQCQRILLRDCKIKYHNMELHQFLVWKRLRNPGNTAAGWFLLNSRKFCSPKREASHKTREAKETFRKAKILVEETIYRENILTIPNALCVSRIFLSPVLAYLVVNDSLGIALSLFVLAGLTDLLDGFIARRFTSQQSMLGSFLDPMADKFLIFFLVLSLTWKELIPVPLTALIIIRDICLMSAGFYIRYQSLPTPRTLFRYFDITHATARITPTFISKLNTAVQLGLVAFTLAAPVFHYVDHAALQGLWYATAATTVASGLSYLFSKNTYQMLKRGTRND